MSIAVSANYGGDKFAVAICNLGWIGFTLPPGFGESAPQISKGKCSFVYRWPAPRLPQLLSEVRNPVAVAVAGGPVVCVAFWNVPAAILMRGGAVLVQPGCDCRWSSVATILVSPPSPSPSQIPISQPSGRSVASRGTAAPPRRECVDRESNGNRGGPHPTTLVSSNAALVSRRATRNRRHRHLRPSMPIGEAASRNCLHRSGTDTHEGTSPIR